MDVLDQYVVPVHDDEFLLLPEASADVPPAESRTPLQGAVLEAGTTYNVVTKVTRTSDDDAAVTSMTLAYRVGSRQYTTTSKLTYELKDRCV
ncbi:hypothetical protein [Quadrisphaera granulorum]|nr:hypothetical protein [Quadrisphaera granulorum]